MKRLLAVVAVAALVLVDGGAANAAGPDPAFPTGTFSVNRTTQEMQWDPEIGWTAPFVISGTWSDDSTPIDQIKREVLRGGEWDPLPWTGTGPFVLDLGHRGTFHPSVRLTDADGHTTLVPLPPLTVTIDDVSPLLLIDPAARSREHRVAAWRVVRLTAADYESGLAQVQVGIVQRRGSRWWVYGFAKQRWAALPRGATRDRAIAAIHRNQPRRLGDAVKVGPETYASPRIRGLTRGRLIVIAEADDHGIGHVRRITTVQLTRR